MPERESPNKQLQRTVRHNVPRRIRPRSAPELRVRRPNLRLRIGSEEEPVSRIIDNKAIAERWLELVSAIESMVSRLRIA